MQARAKLIPPRLGKKLVRKTDSAGRHYCYDDAEGAYHRKPCQKPAAASAASAAQPKPTESGGGLKEQATKIVGKIKPSKQRAFEGKPKDVPKISKQLAGAIGEEIVIQWLRSRGFKDAGHLSAFVGSERNNLPVDLVHDHKVIEVKTGQASNGTGAQQWRLTIGEPGEEEKRWLASATDVEKAAWNADKQQQIHERKAAAIKELEEELGYTVGGGTMTVILDPEAKTADVYEFPGFHDRVGWNTDVARAGYVGSVRYG